MATEGPPTFCATDHGCVTCADEGVEVRVVGIGEDGLVDCVDPAGVRGAVDAALVGPVTPGDALLVHAGVACASSARRWRREVRGGVPGPRPGTRAGGRDPVGRRARPPLQGDGGVRRPHPLHLQVRGRRPPAGQRGAGARPGVPGVRDPDGAGRRRHRHRPRARGDLHLLRRHDARAGSRGQPAGRQGRGRRRADGLLAARRAAHRRRTRTARWCSSRSASRPPPPPPRSR